MASEHYSRTIRRPQSSLRELLDRLDREYGDIRPRDENVSGSSNESLTISYRHHDVPVRVVHPGGGLARFLICTRMLSTNALAFLHGGFLHEDTLCQVLLSTVWGGSEEITGTLSMGRHVEDEIHAFECTFDREVDLGHFVEGLDDPGEIDVSDMLPEDIIGEVLHLDDQTVEHELLAFHLRHTRVKLHPATTIGKGLDEIKQHEIDVVLCDFDLGSQTAEEALDAMRSAGFHGPVIGMSGETDPDRTAKMREKGACTVLSKPYDPSKMMATLAHWLAVVGAGSNDQTIRSRLGDEPGMEPLIRSYVQHVERLALDLRRSIEHQEFDECRHACQVLRETGAGFGYPDLTETGFQAVAALDTSGSIQEAANELRRLEMICGRVE